MTSLSVLVPVYNVADYLPGCLDSVLSSNDPDLEVIAVDDGSTDGSGDILATRAAGDARLQVVRLEGNRGQGHARNLALDRAAGEYVWFVDADDVIGADGLAAVAGALAPVRADVLLLGWESWYGGDRTESNPAAAMLRDVPAAGCTLEDRPELISTTMTSWSKVFRRELLLALRGQGVSFGSGIHEDILVSCAALVSAGVIAAVSQVCYRYRRGRSGSAMATTSVGHRAVFDSYRQVFEFLARREQAGHPVSAALRAAIFERAIWHYSTILETTGPGVGRIGLPGLLPRADRRQFFRQMHDDFVRYRPAGYRPPGGPRGTKFRLIEHDSYAAYSLLEPLNQLRVAVRTRATGH